MLAALVASMTNQATLLELSADQLLDVTGAFNWGEMGAAAMEDGVKGAIGGAVAGAVGGAVTVPVVGSVPGWLAGGGLGFIGGAAGGAVGNIGSQWGIW